MLKEKCDRGNADASHPGITLFLSSSPFVGKGSMYLTVDNGDGERGASADMASEFRRGK
jgi:hypothetical protein